MKMEFIVFLLLIFSLGNLKAQTIASSQSVKVNERMPSFYLQEVLYFTKKEISLDDFKGKWLILDFWSTTCKACVFSFPKINQLQKDLGDKVQFVLIGKGDEKNIRSVYEKYREYYKLTLPIAYDSKLFEVFDVQTVPHIIVIDIEGKVKAITTSDDSFNRENLKSLFRGNSPQFYEKGKSTYSNALKSDITKPLLIDGNGGEGNAFVFRSLLARWNNNFRRHRYERIDLYVDQGFYQGIGIPLIELYNLAYVGVINSLFYDSLYGKFHNRPIFEIDDTSAFTFSVAQEQGLYNYSLIVPPERSSKEYLQQIMRRDLKNYFGYDAEIETRWMPCWKLVASDMAKKELKTKGGAPNNIFYASEIGFKKSNISVSSGNYSLLANIWAYHQLEPPFIDDTGIDYNIDIELNAIMIDLNDIKRALKEKGLDLIKSSKEMKVIVIRNSK